jgi:chemotaxis methyl-accepting protein methylase
MIEEKMKQNLDFLDIYTAPQRSLKITCNYLIQQRNVMYYMNTLRKYHIYIRFSNKLIIRMAYFFDSKNPIYDVINNLSDNNNPT